MRWKGKAAGACLGGLLGFTLPMVSPWLSIAAGTLLGHLADRHRLKVKMPMAGRQLFIMYVHAANADGCMSFRKLNRLHAIVRSLQPRCTEEQLHRIVEHHRLHPRAPESFAGMVARFPPARRRHALLTLFSVVFADHAIDPSTQEWLDRLFRAAGLPERETQSLRAFFEREYAPQHSERLAWLERLEVPAQATPKEIKAAFRRKAADYHPDRLVDVPDAVRRLAGDRMREINEAYQGLLSSPALVEQTLYIVSPTGALTDCTRMCNGDVCSCGVCRKKNRLPDAAKVPYTRCGACHALLALPAEVYA